MQYVKEFDFQLSDNTDEEMTPLIDMLIDSRNVYSQHKFDVGTTRQKFHADVIHKMGDDDEMGSLFVNPIILMPKSDYVKLVVDAQFLNFVTDLTNYSWPLEPVQMIMTRVNGKIFSVTDLSCAYHQVPLSLETQTLTSLIIGGRQYTYSRGFYGLCGLPNFFNRLMTIHFEPLLKRNKQ